MTIMDDESERMTQPIFFMKFGKKEHLESLQNEGLLYMNNLDYFIKLESEKDKKGRGDSNEASLVMQLESFEFIDPDTKKVVLKGMAAKTRITIEEDRKKPVFCMSYFDQRDLQIIKESDDLVEGSLVFSDQQKADLVGEFGNSVLIIFAGNFIQNITRSFEVANIAYAYRKIKYSDYSINYENRIRTFIEHDESKYFWKDAALEYQKEFRLVILNRDVDDHFEVRIGDMSAYSAILPAEKLLKGDYAVTLNFRQNEFKQN